VGPGHEVATEIDKNARVVYVDRDRPLQLATDCHYPQYWIVTETKSYCDEGKNCVNLAPETS
jgi:hypothetical protein